MRNATQTRGALKACESDILVKLLIKYLIVAAPKCGGTQLASFKLSVVEDERKRAGKRRGRTSFFSLPATESLVNEQAKTRHADALEKREYPRETSRVLLRFLAFAVIFVNKESEQNEFSFVARRFSLYQPEHRSGDWKRRERYSVSNEQAQYDMEEGAKQDVRAKVE